MFLKSGTKIQQKNGICKFSGVEKWTLLSYRDDIGEERLPYAGTAQSMGILRDKAHRQVYIKHSGFQSRWVSNISIMLLRHTGLVNKVQKYITQT